MSNNCDHDVSVETTAKEAKDNYDDGDIELKINESRSKEKSHNFRNSNEMMLSKTINNDDSYSKNDNEMKLDQVQFTPGTYDLYISFCVCGFFVI